MQRIERDEIDLNTRRIAGGVGQWLAIVAVIGAIVGCGGDKKVVCPTGYVVEGLFCYPIKNVGGGNDAGAIKDVQSATDAAVADTDDGSGGAADATTDADAAATKDIATPKDTAPPKDGGSGNQNPIGAACHDGFDCLASLDCFSWPNGYCTQTGCSKGGSPCPGSAQCWGETELKMLCVAGCELNGDCRLSDGYACKRLTAAWGGVDTQLCLPTGAAKVGLTCKGPLDCDGEDTCITDIPGGYCARVGCGKGDACATGAACVLREGKPLCLKVCDVDSECQVGGGFTRKCVERTDLTKASVKVCLDTDKAAPIGGECLADLDCQSAKCTIVAKGTCQLGGAPCIADGQCGASGPCELAKEKEIGVCTQPCSKDLACPIGATCVPGDDGQSGSCNAVCQGPGDADTCKVPGTQCIYGVPVAPPGGVATATYACAFRPAGSAGAECSADADCTVGYCFTNIGKTSGFCQPPCGFGKPACLFGSTCINSGLATCQRLCSVDYDCPIQMICTSSATPPHKTCTKP